MLDFFQWVVVISNISFLLPINFFLSRIYNLSCIDRYQNKSVNEMIIYALCIYSPQLLITIITLYNSVHFHLFEQYDSLRWIDVDSVSLTLCINFSFIISDSLFMKNSLDSYFIVSKFIGILLGYINMFEMSEIPAYLFIVICICRNHIILINYRLILMALFSIICFLVSTISENIALEYNYTEPLLIYKISHSIWHVAIGITYYQALLNIKKSVENTAFYNIEEILIESRERHLHTRTLLPE